MASAEVSQEEKYAVMTTQPVEKLVCRLAIPTIVCMLISSLYNMVDTVFVGELTTQAVAAVGVCYPFMTFVQAFGYFFAQGSGNYLSRAMGARHFDKASCMACSGLLYALIFGVLFSALGMAFIAPLARLLGAYDEIWEDTLAYLRWIVPATPFLMGSIVLNLQLRFQGNALRSMVGIGSGAVVNLVLDPLLIFVFEMGVSGAALATFLGQAVGFFVLYVQVEKHGAVKLRWREYRFSGELLLEMLRGGSPSFFRQGMGSASNICLNMMAKPYGAAAIAAFSAVSRVMNLATSAVNGFGQGFQPVCGFNYGAKLHGRVKRAYRFSLKVEFAACVLFSLFGLIFAEPIIALIRDEDPEILRIGKMALRLQCLTFPMISVVSLTNMTTQVMGKTAFAIVEAMARQGVFFIPAALLLPSVLDIKGLALAQPVSDVCAAVISLVVLRSVWKELREEQPNERNLV